MYGSTKSAQDNIYLCLGTGIGGAAFINNKLVEPRYKSGMEFGHMIIQKMIENVNAEVKAVSNHIAL